MPIDYYFYIHVFTTPVFSSKRRTRHCCFFAFLRHSYLVFYSVVCRFPDILMIFGLFWTRELLLPEFKIMRFCTIQGWLRLALAALMGRFTSEPSTLREVRDF